MILSVLMMDGKAAFLRFLLTREQVHHLALSVRLFEVDSLINSLEKGEQRELIVSRRDIDIKLEVSEELEACGTYHLVVKSCDRRLSAHLLKKVKACKMSIEEPCGRGVDEMNEKLINRKLRNFHPSCQPAFHSFSKERLEGLDSKLSGTAGKPDLKTLEPSELAESTEDYDLVMKQFQEHCKVQ